MSIDMEAVILEIVGKLPAGKSVSSEEVARAAEPERWQRLTGHVRATARGLAQEFMQQHRGAARLTAAAIGTLLGIAAAP